MSVCFICNTTLYGVQTRVCSSITPYSNVSYPEKIAELIGDEVVVIVTPADRMCKNCTLLLTHMDKLENDLGLVKNAMLSDIQKKYGILPPDQAVKVDNSEEQVEQVGQFKVPSSPTVGVSPAVTTAAVVMPVKIPSKLLKTQQQQQQQQQQQPQKQPPPQQKQQPQQQQQQQPQKQPPPQQKQPQQQPQKQPPPQQKQQPQQQKQQPQKQPPPQQKQQPQQQKQPPPQQQQQPQQHPPPPPQPQQQQQPPPTQTPIQQEIASRMKLYKCGFCMFQSKDLGHVRFHMRTHGKKKEPEKPVVNQAIDKALTPAPQPKRRIYRCQVCSASFDTRVNCVDHIHKDHPNNITSSTSNAEKGTDESCPVTNKIMKPEPLKTQEDNQQVESPMDADKNHRDNNKATVDTDMSLDNHVPTEGSADVEPEKENENSLGDKTEKEVKLVLKSEPTEEEEEEDTAILGQEEADQETPVIVKKEVVENDEYGENGSELDIESMLAAIHNDNSTD